MFNKILIANRGEIACRIIRTLRRLGIQAVAVYSDADRNAQHVLLADEAYYLGAAPTTHSYLRSELILEIAKRCHVDAIHPGYGFLSENAEFAKQCAANHIVFIGPSADAIEKMGDKAHAKQLMAIAKVPILPGYHDDDQNEATLLAAAKKIGFPVLLKASAGGGGKGMRVVTSEKEFSLAFQSTTREAQKSFGDPRLIIEKYLEKPRHIEIQLFADQHGNCVYLFERDCSIQRRHQKVVEEAPAPHFSAALRTAMGETAVKAAKAINYLGAGTIEFLLDSNQQYYFMEMNTRLQVEHPITEKITGLDLVEWQIRVALGETLPCQQDQLHIHGHAIETRIYAEDPKQQFLPAIGRLDYLATPTTTEYVRLDSGFVSGDEITPYYDPMIAKLITWGDDRTTAVRRMQQALQQYHIVGVKTNLEFLSRLLHETDFQNGALNTHFIDDHQNSLLNFPPCDLALLASIAVLHGLLKPIAVSDPFAVMDGWQANLPARQYHYFEHDKTLIPLTLEPTAAGYAITVLDQTIIIAGKQTLLAQAVSHWVYDLQIVVQRDQHNEQVLTARVITQTDNPSFTVICQQQQASFRRAQALTTSKIADNNNNFLSPMPGTVIEIFQSVGTRVAAGDPIITLEAMKMEHCMKAPCAGTIKAINYQVGALVDEGAELVIFEPEQLA